MESKGTMRKRLVVASCWTHRNASTHGKKLLRQSVSKLAAFFVYQTTMNLVSTRVRTMSLIILVLVPVWFWQNTQTQTLILLPKLLLLLLTKCWLLSRRCCLQANSIRPGLIKELGCSTQIIKLLHDHNRNNHDGQRRVGSCSCCCGRLHS